VQYAPLPLDVDPQALLEVCLCHGVRRAARAVARIYDGALRPFGLTSGQFTILAAVAANPAVPAPVLRHLLVMDRTTLSRTLKPLKENGLLEISGGPGRRGGRIALTEDGGRVLRQAAPAWRQAQAAVSQRLGPGRAGQFLRILSAATAAATPE
jgi:DNA-binding MarR family transcriptional regulator